MSNTRFNAECECSTWANFGSNSIVAGHRVGCSAITDEDRARQAYIQGTISDGKLRVVLDKDSLMLLFGAFTADELRVLASAHDLTRRPASPNK